MLFFLPFITSAFTLCIRETPIMPILVLLQTVKAQMKYRIISSGSSLFVLGKMSASDKSTIFFERFNLTPLDMYNGPSQVYCIKPERRIHQ